MFIQITFEYYFEMFVNARNVIIECRPVSYVNRSRTLDKLYTHLTHITKDVVKVRKTYYHYANLWKDDFKDESMPDKDLSIIQVQGSNDLFDWIHRTIPEGIDKQKTFIALDLYIKEKEYPSLVMDDMKSALLAMGNGETCDNNEYIALVALYAKLYREWKRESDQSGESRQSGDQDC